MSLTQESHNYTDDYGLLLPLEESYPDHVCLGGGNGTALAADRMTEVLGYGNVAFIVPTGDSGGNTGLFRRMISYHYKDQSGQEVTIPMPAGGDLRRVTGAVGSNYAAALGESRLGEHDGLRYVSDTLSEFYESMHQPRGTESDRVHAILDRSMSIAEEMMDANGTLHRLVIGNLVMAGLFEHNQGDIGAAAAEYGRWLDARAHVLPSSIVPHHLDMEYMGQTYETEAVIDEMNINNPDKAIMSLRSLIVGKEVEIYDPARQIIEDARTVSFLPSSLLTSHAQNSLVCGMSEALAVNRKNGGESVLFVNPVHGKDTNGLNATRFALMVSGMAGHAFRKIVVNRDLNGVEKVTPIDYDGVPPLDADIISAQLLQGAAEQQANDPTERSSVVTDGGEVARVLVSAA